jgi:hypothetical protein
MKKLNAICLPALLIGLSLSATQIAHAVSYGNDNVGCVVDRPCLNYAYQVDNSIVFDFRRINSWDFHRFRYKNVKGKYVTTEQKSRIFTLKNTRPRHEYTVEVQGCWSSTAWVVFKKESCSPWVQESFTTR